MKTKMQASQKLWRAGVVVLVLATLTGCEHTAHQLFQLDFRGIINDTFDACHPGMPPNPELEKIRKEHYRNWPKPMREAVDEHRVVVDMDKLQVQLAMRLEESMIQKQMEAGRETWIVWNLVDQWISVPMKHWRRVRIRFQDDKVVEVAR